MSCVLILSLAVVCLSVSQLLAARRLWRLEHEVAAMKLRAARSITFRHAP